MPDAVARHEHARQGLNNQAAAWARSVDLQGYVPCAWLSYLCMSGSEGCGACECRVQGVPELGQSMMCLVGDALEHSFLSRPAWLTQESSGVFLSLATGV